MKGRLAAYYNGKSAGGQDWVALVPGFAVSHAAGFYPLQEMGVIRLQLLETQLGDEA
jgi:hypothetical protein